MGAEQAVILFHTSSHALRAEKVLKQEDIPCKLVPVPRHLSSDCGVCLRIPRRVRAAAEVTIKAARVEIVSIHGI